MTDLVGLLQEAANHAPDHGVGYVQDDGSVRVESYPALLTRAACVLGGLRQRGLRAGDHVVLALSGTDTFLAAFWGCVLGGIIPVPVPAATAPGKGGALAEGRLHNVRRVLGCPPVLVDDRVPGTATDADHWWPLADVSADVPDDDFCARPPSDTAFIQFSSGSTGQPKGVVLTHRNVVANLAAIHQGLGAVPEDVGVNWMPLYHDMGLVGFHLTPLYYRRPQYHLNPSSMIRRPLLWLDTLERHRGTITACPNFGQALVLSRLERDPDRRWDLSSVRLILDGAEPIAAPIVRRFQAQLARFGVRDGAVMPVYGMAEATLAVTFPPAGLPPRIETLDRQALQRDGEAVPAAPDAAFAMESVGLGSPVEGCDVRVVTASDQLVTEGIVGHVQIRGESVTSGYAADPAATAAAFCDGWLRTGDLGYRRGGCLFVTGRAKDVVFVHGQNVYAHDLEQLAAQVDGVSPGRVAVCGWHDPQAGQERLLLFLVARNPTAAAPLFAAVNRRFQEAAGITADVMVPLEPSQLPKTTSGKIQRYRLRELFEEGVFDGPVLDLSRALTALERQQPRLAPRTPTEVCLHELWCSELRLPPENVGVGDDYTHLGGTSLQALRIMSELEGRFGVRIHSAALADHPTIARLAAYLDRHRAGLGRRGAGRATYFQG
jgi:acyl-CoA synthetase (AMP-forming)/AMP-acid ligase II/acyl carrier protein